MIQHLVIQNYALIKNLEMYPSDKLNVITGETGAGKSIMLGALGLLLGNRADKKALFAEDSKCLIEATFFIKDYKLQAFFDKWDLDYEDHCIIRREITPAGKSRSFVNDTPVTLDILKALGEKLVDIHSQNTTHAIGESHFQLKIIDQFAGTSEARRFYQSQYKNYLKLNQVYEDLVTNQENYKKEFEFNSFQLEELKKAHLEEVDLRQLESDLEILENAEEIKAKFGLASSMLDNNEFSINQGLSDLLAELKSIKGFSKDYEELFERINSSYVELKDILTEINNQADRIEIDPEELLTKRERLDSVQRLLQKHFVSSVQELIAIRDDLQEKVSKVENLDEEIHKAQRAREDAFTKLMEAGVKLSNSRRDCFENLETKLRQLLQQVGIFEALLKIRCSRVNPSKTGLDDIELLFSANKGVAPQSLKNVASGGEFSRLTFCIKRIMADKTALPTMIFDEIDSGVSGEVALKMVRMMKEMARNHQVISISHLPQFAAAGDAHYFVFKDSSDVQSVSKIRKLSNEESVKSIAKMISGSTVTNSALESARELVGAVRD